jgi:LytS/YehU family sensor histidine kinase
MRIVLENSQKNLITIERELSALQLYLEIESIRFKDKFQYSIEIDINIDKGLCKIPPLLLQPYAENAIWHGLMNLEKDEVGKLNIELKLVDGLMHCAIIDNGVGREKAKELSSNKNKSYESLGSKINKNRLESIKFSSDSNVSINYYDLFDNNGNPNGTKVLLFLPVIY